MWFANIFSHSVGCLFTLGIVSMIYKIKKFLWSLICLFLILLLVPLVSYPRNHCQIQCHEAFALCFHLRVLVLVLIFRSLIHFDLNFAYGVRWGSNFIFSHVDIRFSLYHLLKDSPFHIEWPQHPWQKSFDHVCKGLFLSLFQCQPVLITVALQ